MIPRASLSPALYPVERAHSPVLMAREDGLPAPSRARLLDPVRDAIRARHYSRRTEKAYAHWIKGPRRYPGSRRHRTTTRFHRDVTRSS
jgi:hypothetical protein